MLIKRLITWLALAGFFLGLPTVLWAYMDQKALAEEVERRRRHVCGLIDGCTIPASLPLCARDNSTKELEIQYDEMRCRLPRALARDGLSPARGEGYRVFELLGRPYQVQYEHRGELPISAPQLSIILTHLPLGAHLLNTFAGREYEAEVREVGRIRWIHGRKGERFQGRARVIAGAPDRGMLVYHGFGSAGFWKWEFSGQVLLQIVWQPDPSRPDRSRLLVRVVAPPGNQAVNQIMDSALFHMLVTRFVKNVLDDLADAVNQAVAAGPTLVDRYPWA